MITYRAGTTLLEMIIALGIFTTLLVGIMQTYIASRNYTEADTISNDLELEGIRIMAELTNDLSNSAWFGQAPSIDPNNNKPAPMSDSPVTFPNVGKGNLGKGTTNWGDQLDFVKIRSKAGTYLSPNQMKGGASAARINFLGTEARPLDDFINADTLLTLVVNPNYVAGSTEEPFVWPVFESAVAPLTYSENASFSNPAYSPRLYRYIVREKPGSIFGQLVRQYSNGPGTVYGSIPEHNQKLKLRGDYIQPPAVTNTPNPWVDDAIISNDIKPTTNPNSTELNGKPGIQFDTYLTDQTLGPNQIRIKIILMKESKEGLVGGRTLRIIQSSVAMRSITY